MAPTSVPIELGGAAESQGDSSALKMFGILDLFSPDRSIWTATDIHDALGSSRSTTYRYIRTLLRAGFLAAVGNGHYVLGPRIVELDLQIRSTDPLHQLGQAVLEELSRTTGHSALLCTLFGDVVICVREHLVPLSPKNLFSRGQRRPLFSGAASKAILAYLPQHKLRQIYSANVAEAEAAGLGQCWREFREKLGRIRRCGFAMTSGEFVTSINGVAAPILTAQGEILGSVGIAWHKDDAAEVELSRMVLSVKRAGRVIGQRIGPGAHVKGSDVTGAD